MLKLKVKLKWEGQVDYDDVAGEILLPYVSEDVTDSEYEIKITSKERDDPRWLITCTPMFAAIRPLPFHREMHDGISCARVLVAIKRQPSTSRSRSRTSAFD